MKIRDAFGNEVKGKDRWSAIKGRVSEWFPQATEIEVEPGKSPTILFRFGAAQVTIQKGAFDSGFYEARASKGGVAVVGTSRDAKEAAVECIKQLGVEMLLAE